MQLKILQINLGKGKAATMLLQNKIISQNYEVIFIQEPYSKFKGFLGFETYKIGDDSRTMTLVKRGLGKAWMRRDCSSESVVVVELERRGKEGNVVMVNIYDRPPDARNTLSVFRELTVWLGSRREHMLLAGDLNGKNVAWGGRDNNERGVEIQEWMMMNGWKVENCPEDPPSFCSNRGVSWVDLVASKGVKVEERWIDTEEDTLSDHRYISYLLQVGRLSREESRVRYEVENVDWTRYETLLRETWEERGRDFQQRRHGGVEEKGALLQSVVQEACGKGMRKKGRRRRERKEWWSERLEHERRETRRARVRFQQADGDERDRLRTEYVTKRNEYKKQIKGAKLRVMEEELER